MSAVLDESLATSAAVATLPKSAARQVRPVTLPLAAAVLTWALLGVLTLWWPNKPAAMGDWAYTRESGCAALLIAAGLFSLHSIARVWARFEWIVRLHALAPWLVALAAGLGAWEVVTAKLGLLPAPFFAPPTALVEVYLEDWKRLADCALGSLRLLLFGVSCGAAAGFLIGVAVGWSRAVGYWAHPVIRFLGPIPASALLPLAFFAFPSSYSAAVFLIALATAFPVTILTWSGVAGVNRSYYDVARTLGANEWFLIRRVAIPAALPQVFVGLFMGLGASFSILVTAEMMGVKSGLGWYLTWAQGWASYSNMYAALLVMAVVCSSLITLLFALRARVLSWQKGTLKW